MRPISSWDILGIVTISTVIAALNHLHKRREYHRKAALVRASLGGKRCHRCDGDLGAWDGRFERGDAHFNPGGYLPRISVSCERCHAKQVFYATWDGRLSNRDAIFGIDISDELGP